METLDRSVQFDIAFMFKRKLRIPTELYRE